MTYRVVVSRRARNDADEIYLWIAARSPDGAQRWFVAFLSAVDQLVPNPIGYGLAPEADWLGEDLRQLLFKTPRGLTYRALFVVRGDVIHVVCVRGPGQDLLTRGDLELFD